MAHVELEQIVQFFDHQLGVPDFPDYPNAFNGLQVEGPRKIRRIAAAVDCSLEAIRAAVETNADLLVVHHGLFWGGVQPLKGPFHAKVSTLVTSNLALYSAHLPLDAHPELGNSAILAGEIGVDREQAFGAYEGREIGWRGRLEVDRGALRDRLAGVLGGDIRVVPGGPERVGNVAVVTGGGASFLPEAASTGVDTLITGEASHHNYHDAMELGVNLYLGGHYATETWGVRALAERGAHEFELEWEFLDFPTGL